MSMSSHRSREHSERKFELQYLSSLYLFAISNGTIQEFCDEESQKGDDSVLSKMVQARPWPSEYTRLNGTRFGIKGIANNANEELPLGWTNVLATPNAEFVQAFMLVSGQLGRNWPWRMA